MKIDFKKPRYIIPLIAIPFLCLFFYAYQQWHAKSQVVVMEKDVNGNLAEISDQVREKGLSDKLEAYKNSFKEADGYSAIKTVDEDRLPEATITGSYSEREKQKLDSIEASIKKQAYMSRPSEAKSHSGYAAIKPDKITGLKPEDRAVAQALASLEEARKRERHAAVMVNKETDPMDLFKKQMAYMDSMGKAADPSYIAQQKEKKRTEEGVLVGKNVLRISRSAEVSGEFNTISVREKQQLITAIIDEDITGYSGSRIRLRLLEEVYAGKSLLTKGTYLYARISGFSEQRVQLEINSVHCAGKILPVKLLLYDLDGLPGSYVPASAFREFSKGLGASSVQGFNTMGSALDQNEFVMSTASRLFQSTSSAIANMVRKNRAKLKYNNQVFLVDPRDLQK